MSVGISHSATVVCLTRKEIRYNVTVADKSELSIGCASVFVLSKGRIQTQMSKTVCVVLGICVAECSATAFTNTHK